MLAKRARASPSVPRIGAVETVPSVVDPGHRENLVSLAHQGAYVLLLDRDTSEPLCEPTRDPTEIAQAWDANRPYRPRPAIVATKRNTSVQPPAEIESWWPPRGWKPGVPVLDPTLQPACAPPAKAVSIAQVHPLPTRPADRSTKSTLPVRPAHEGKTRRTTDSTPSEPQLPDGIDRFSDVWCAARFAASHRHQLRWCHERGWMAWDGTRWTQDDRRPELLAQKFTKSLALEAIDSTDMSQRKGIQKLFRSGTVHAMVDLARSRLAVRMTAFDADPWLFNVANGTIDLRTGECRAHQREDLLTKRSLVVYDPAATAPTWEAHLTRVLPDPEARAFLQRFAGYALTGVVRDHVLPVHWGDGGNGKGVTFNTLLHVWGEYARPVPPELLMQRDGHEEHPTERAQLLGLRLAVASETKRGRGLNESLVKLLTGGDPISARFMRQDYFHFLPTHKLALLTNYKPVVSGTDRGIWRRLLLMPWTVNIPEHEQDTSLEERLRAEAAGILAWAVEGCLAWQRDGLEPPALVQEASAKYRAQSDVLGRFLTECCLLGSDLSAQSSVLYAAFDAWCKENGERTPSLRMFGEELVRRGFEKTTPQRQAWYAGVGLRGDS